MALAEDFLQFWPESATRASTVNPQIADVK
jgi:hypothetical protein